VKNGSGRAGNHGREPVAKFPIVSGPIPPLVSVIIPCYNAGPWIGEAIRSALDQTYSPIEVIVIDDGSVDRSLEVIKSFGGRIRWETGPNQGGSRARNRGFALSAGEYIQFLDADDYLLPGKIERQMRVVTGSRADVVYEDYQNLLESADGTRTWGPLDISGSQADMLEMMLGGWAPPPCALLVSRSAVERAGGWNENLTSAQDNDFYLRLALAGSTFRYAPGCKSVYRRPAVPTVSTRDARATDENVIRILDEARTNLLEAGRLTEEYKRAIARSYFRIARKYFDTDVAWFHRLLREAERLTPSVADGQSRKYRLVARALGIPGAESIRSLKRAAARQVSGAGEALKDNAHRVWPRQLPILLYHNVGPLPAEDSFNLTIAPEQFERQMRWLVARGYQTILPSEWVAARRESRALPGKAVLLTFDDGYADIVEYAFPVLRRLGLKAAAYVVTGRLGRTNTWDEAEGYPTMRLMTAEQVRGWAGQGIEFGSHTRTHRDLTTLDAAALEDEIAGSADDLRRIAGAPAVSFAYPYGRFSDAAREIVAQAYGAAVSCEEGTNNHATDPFLLRRTIVNRDDSRTEYFARLRLGRNPLRAAFKPYRIWKRLTGSIDKRPPVQRAGGFDREISKG